MCERAGILLFSLPVGAWADRLRCRPLLVGADLGRFVLLGSIPVAAAFDLLGVGQLYVVLVLMGIHTAVVATVVLFQSAIGAITIVFLVREIGLGPAAIGLLSMIGLLAAVVGRW